MEGKYVMGGQTVTLEALKGRPLEEFLREIVEQNMTVTVMSSDGQSTTLEPKPCLRPLPVLEGCVPQGWKDALYT